MNGNFNIGMESPELVVELVKMHSEIELIKLQEYTPHALGVTEQLKEKPEVPVKNLIRHHPDIREYKIDLAREDVTSDKLRKLIAEALTRDKALVLCSKVQTFDDDILHIPMLDFECEVSDKNLSKVTEFIDILGKSGVVLESGRSYHYYGFDLLSDRKWRQFMCRAGLFTGFTDSRHIYHRLLSGEARLRLAKIEGSERYIQTPRVVSVIPSFSTVIM